MFNQKGIDVIRVGLQNTDEITDPNIEGSISSILVLSGKPTII